MKLWKLGRRTALFGVLAYSGFLSACKDGEPTVPAAITVVSGNQQTAVAAALVPIAPSVKVTTASGKPVKGVPVTFAPATGSGTVVGGSQITDALGVATVTSWTLGTKAGVNTLTVTVAGVTPMSITANTTPGAPAAIAISAGDAQTGTVGKALSIAPAVRVSDFYDNGVPGVTVTFAASNSSVQTTSLVTDASGVASAGTWTLGTKSGSQSVIATAVAANLTSSPVTFSAVAAPDVASQLAVVTQPYTSNQSGEKFSVQPVVEFRDRYNNVASAASRSVTASVASGTGTLGGTLTITSPSPRATFTDLAYTGTGSVTLRFTSSGLPDATSASFDIGAIVQCTGGPSLALDYTIGQSGRYLMNAAAAPQCLDFSNTRNAGQQYVVMFENLSPRGNYSFGVFPGSSSDDGAFSYSLTAKSPSGSTSTVAVSSANRVTTQLPAVIDGWDVGGKTAIEISPQPPAGGAPSAKVQQDGDVAANSLSAAPNVGDTISVYLEGIPRLNGVNASWGSAGLQRAVVRFQNADLIIAEDVRFSDPTFLRSNGSRNTPIPAADLQSIADNYKAYGKVQADRFFSGRHNAATEGEPTLGRPIAVHTMMFADNIWGYTYSSPNYFAFDYWVNCRPGTGTTDCVKDVYQDNSRIADDLFMHEIAHMRHWGMLERAGRTAVRGNLWLVEGFARFIERLPIAQRLLGATDFSRTSNAVLQRNPNLTGYPSCPTSCYFFDDVPTYLQAGSSMYGGYGASSFVFDYFSDQVAAKGGNWITALQELLVSAGVQSDLDIITNGYLGIDFGTLFSRSRIALYTDDLGNAGLPAWTQYLQYQLRASRPPSTNAPIDPRNFWNKVTPGAAYSDARNVESGGAYGYLIDGTLATGDSHIQITPTKVPNGIMTIVRIK